MAVKVNGVPYDRPANPFHAENDSLILGTDAIPSPGFSRVRFVPSPIFCWRTANDVNADVRQFGTRTPKGDITITNRVQGVTVGAAAFFQGTAILHVLSNAIRVLEPGTSRDSRPRSANAEFTTDGTERQIIKDMEGNNQRPRIKYCSICDPFVFILREDDTIGLFIGEPERGKIRRKDMSPMGEKVSFNLHSLY
jgi:cleavage and polyadenylation specificity factor subunit 1